MRLRASLLGGALLVIAVAAGALVELSSIPARALDTVRTRLTSCSLPGLRCAPLGVFLHQRIGGAPLDPAFEPADPAILTSSAWVDLSPGPTALTLPAFGTRFFAIQIRNARGDLVGLASARTIGTSGGTITIGEPRDGNARPDVPVSTRFAWIVASIEADGESDEAAVTALQDAMTLRR